VKAGVMRAFAVGVVAALIATTVEQAEADEFCAGKTLTSERSGERQRLAQRRFEHPRTASRFNASEDAGQRSGRLSILIPGRAGSFVVASKRAWIWQRNDFGSICAPAWIRHGVNAGSSIV